MKRALISVYNKDGVVEFAKGLEFLNYEIISTGGTYKLLEHAGVKNLKKVNEITGFPEIMDGRVKTLNPKVHGGILADRSKASHKKEAREHHIEMIDLVVVNLYPFKETISQKDATEEQAIENIDIGGPTMIRAAAKNYKSVYVVVDPNDYQEVLNQLEKDSVKFRRSLAEKAFEHTFMYDQVVYNYFSGGENLSLNFKKVRDLRYGENPHQQASLYKDSGQGIVGAEVLHGKELSYNNIMDADGALNLIKEFDQPAAAVIKHTNPCGCAIAEDVTQAFTKAYAADSKSAFGGIIILNRECNKEIAEEINKVFAEIVIAPDYQDEALRVLKQKKNIRILKVKDQLAISNQQGKDYKKVKGGILEQDFDKKMITEKDLEIVSQEKPAQDQIDDLLFAWKVVKHVKSNAIVLVKAGVTLSIGAGQMSRVDAVEIALTKGGDKVNGSVLASDAFFPFRDGLDKLAQNGVKSVIQPGGSIKDKDVIEACNEHKISMVFTGFRAFRH